MLAPEMPADVHQLDRVQRRAPAPRRAGRVRALALERVLIELRIRRCRRRLGARSGWRLLLLRGGGERNGHNDRKGRSSAVGSCA